MRFLIFFTFLLTVYSQGHDHHTFRYKGGDFTVGNGPVVKLEGTTFYDKSNGIHIVNFVGMDFNTMTPVIIFGYNETEKSNPVDVVYTCLGGMIGKNDPKVLQGKFTIKGTWEEARIEGSCYNNTSEPWKFNASIIKVADRFFKPEEAGLRARIFIGKKPNDFSAPQVVMYSIIDYPYFTADCNDFLTMAFPDILYPEKGAIIVGKDGKHCGIINDRGTEFINSCKDRPKIEEIPLAMIGKYFPQGVVYKRYPKLESKLPSIKFYD